MRDDANIQQLLVLANMESYNAILIERGKPQSERMVLLCQLDMCQMRTTVTVPAELIGCFQIIFYQSAEDALFKALGVE